MVFCSLKPKSGTTKFCSVFLMAESVFYWVVICISTSKGWHLCVWLVIREVSVIKSVISKHMLRIKLMSTYWVIALRCMSHTTCDKSILLEVLAWCH